MSTLKESSPKSKTRTEERMQGWLPTLPGLHEKMTLGALSERWYCPACLDLPNVAGFKQFTQFVLSCLCGLLRCFDMLAHCTHCRVWTCCCDVVSTLRNVWKCWPLGNINNSLGSRWKTREFKERSHYRHILKHNPWRTPFNLFVIFNISPSYTPHEILQSFSKKDEFGQNIRITSLEQALFSRARR